MDITKIDKNFTQAQSEDGVFTYYNPYEKPFSFEGFPWYEHNGNKIYRLPIEHRALYTRQQDGLSNHSAGGVFRFKTNSEKISIKATYEGISRFPHMQLTGSAGFDVYKKEGDRWMFIANLYPNTLNDNFTDKQCETHSDGQMCEYIIYMPIYSIVEKCAVGVETGAEILPPNPHRVEKPVLFYGSSITQGACSSRPGITYTARLTRAVDAPLINLGFSGNALGEAHMAEFIASLDLSVFVMDYHFNSPNAQHLDKTHKPFFDIFRKKNPDTPVIIVSTPSVNSARNSVVAGYDAVIKATYDAALAAGDKNVYFVNGSAFFDGVERSDCSVDLTHPNDYGFALMTNGILPVLKKALGI
ncbi:MAG: hypothetical protein IKB89_04205 [Clostridia bacterium]|nr:hypothetical protein [Clostridia bacterium]